MKIIYVIIIVIGTVIFLKFILNRLMAIFETLATMPGRIREYDSELSEKLKDMNSKNSELLAAAEKEVSECKKVIELLEQEHAEFVADIELTNKAIDSVFENLQLLSQALKTSTEAVKEQYIAAYLDNAAAAKNLVQQVLDKYGNREALLDQAQSEFMEEDGEETHE